MQMMPLALPVAASATTARLDGRRAYGTILAGGLLVALPVDHTREVVPRPDELHPFPQLCPLVCGALLLRGSIIPVVDLGRLLGVSLVAARVIVVMRCEGRLLGLLADGVGDIDLVGADQLEDLVIPEQGGGTGAIPVVQTLRLEDRVASVLCPHRVLAHPGLPSVPETSGGEREGDAERSQPLLLFRLAGYVFAVAADAVATTLPIAELGASPVVSDLCLGVVIYREHQVPVIDPLFLLGIDRVERPVRSAAALILRLGADSHVGLLIHDVIDILRFSRTSMNAPPAGIFGDASLLEAILRLSDGTDVMLLDHRQLEGEERLCGLAAIARLSQQKAQATAAEGGRRVAGEGEPFLVFSAGGRFAMPLIETSEIIMPPAHVTRVRDRADGIAGFFSYRGSGVTIIDLAAWLRRMPSTSNDAEARLLIVRGTRNVMAFQVEAVHAIEHGRIRHSSPAAREGRPGARYLPDEMLEYVEDGELRSLSLLHLARLADEI
ncbi:chemotaxis protein CheW [Rhizobium straminoryzae]|uniref:CheW-like domain-containing protein n=1 Tax=Rhizobium straminoryzae TaxID=1387186 RepID=A0A549T5Y6_9HYPH|nr:chemotaxis protein CheW [Rhizobium straminoryzae]TRL37262.1 hypothetical protein FNA46_15795 [Rhizobium straminoryzae]